MGQCVFLRIIKNKHWLDTHQNIKIPKSTKTISVIKIGMTNRSLLVVVIKAGMVSAV